jgi:hypothetical protein
MTESTHEITECANEMNQCFSSINDNGTSLSCFQIIVSTNTGLMIIFIHQYRVIPITICDWLQSHITTRCLSQRLCSSRSRMSCLSGKPRLETIAGQISSFHLIESTIVPKHCHASCWPRLTGISNNCNECDKSGIEWQLPSVLTSLLQSPPDEQFDHSFIHLKWQANLSYFHLSHLINRFLKLNDENHENREGTRCFSVETHETCEREQFVGLWVKCS